MRGSSLVDAGAIERLTEFGGGKLLRGMVELFVRDAPRKAADAREALDCGDAPALRAALHSLKSSAGQLGAATVFAACSAGEELSSRGELAGCAEHLARIETDLPLACGELLAIAEAT